MTSIPPAALLEDEHLYVAAAEQAERAEWTQLHELLAVNAEISHSVLRQLMANAGAKRSDLPDPLRYPRPGGAESPGVRSVRPGELARMLRRP